MNAIQFAEKICTKIKDWATSTFVNKEESSNFATKEDVKIATFIVTGLVDSSLDREFHLVVNDSHEWIFNQEVQLVAREVKAWADDGIELQIDLEVFCTHTGSGTESDPYVFIPNNFINPARIKLRAVSE